MASPFSGLAALCRAQTTAMSGEAAELRPMARGGGLNAAAAADPTREATELTAIFAEEPAQAFDSARVASFAPLAVAGSTLTATFDGGGLDLRAGLDRLARLADNTVWLISTVEPDGLGGVTCRLSRAE